VAKRVDLAFVIRCWFEQRSWWAQTLLAWALTRIVATAAFLWAASIQGPSHWSPTAHPGYFDFLNIWDVEWYHRIFTAGLGHEPGYPSVLPTYPDGSVKQNAWAFMPGFPLLVRALTWITGGAVEWKYLAPSISLLLSFGLAIMMYKIFAIKFDHATSLWAVALFGFWCASPVLQAGYAETLGLLLLAGGLYFLMQHRYLAALPWLVGLSITRPGMVSFAATLAGMWVVRYIKHSRGKDDFSSKERWGLGGLALASAALGLAWPVVAWIATGRSDAYTASELAWRMVTPNPKLVPFDGWLTLGASLWGDFWAPMFLLLLLGIAAWVLFLPSVRRLGNELRLWVAAYLAYVFVFFNPQSSTFRILLPAFPLVAAFALKTRGWGASSKWFVLIGLTITQLIWLAICWVYVNPDYTPP
jgi:hypothetical protein